MNSKPNETPASRQSVSRWSFSLRELLLFVAIVAVGLGWAGREFGWWSPLRAIFGSTQMRDAARRAYEMRVAEYEAGTTTFEDMAAYADRWADAERLLCTTREQELAVLRDHVQRMTDWRRRAGPRDKATAHYHYERARWQLAQLEGTGALAREAEAQKQLAGIWRVESKQPMKSTTGKGQLANAPVEGHEDRIAFLHFDGGHVWFGPERYSSGDVFDIDPAASPATIDINVNEGDHGFDLHGVYAVQGDTLQLCLACGNTSRPAVLSANDAPSCVSYVLKRFTPGKTQSRDPGSN